MAQPLAGQSEEARKKTLRNSVFNSYCSILVLPKFLIEFDSDLL